MLCCTAFVLASCGTQTDLSNASLIQNVIDDSKNSDIVTVRDDLDETTTVVDPYGPEADYDITVTDISDDMSQTPNLSISVWYDGTFYIPQLPPVVSFECTNELNTKNIHVHALQTTVPVSTVFKGKLATADFIVENCDVTGAVSVKGVLGNTDKVGLAFAAQWISQDGNVHEIKSIAHDVDRPVRIGEAPFDLDMAALLDRSNVIDKSEQEFWMNLIQGSDLLHNGSHYFKPVITQINIVDNN